MGLTRMEDEAFERLYRSWFDLTKGFFPTWSQLGDSPLDASPQFQSWQSSFEKLRESLLRLPPAAMFEGTAGLALDSYEDYWKSQIELFRRSTDLLRKFSDVWVEGSRTAQHKLASESAEPTENPGKRAYQVWIDELAKAFDVLLRDPNFSKELGGMVSSYLEVKGKGDALLERYYSRMNIPTRSEVDKIHKELHDLKKKVDRIPRDETRRGRKRAVTGTRT